MTNPTKDTPALARGWQHRLTVGAALLGLVTVALLWSGIVFHLAQRETAAIEQTHREVASLSVGFEEHVERLVAGIDQVMRFAEADFKADPSHFDLKVWHQRAEALRALDAQMSLIDARGRAVAATYPLVAGAPSDASQRLFFRTHAERADTGLLIDPVVTGRSTGTPIILFSRRLSLPDGGFGGVITVSLNPQHLAGAFAAADLGPGGSVTLIGRDGFVRARTPSYPGVYERSLRESPAGRVLFEHLERGASGTCRIGSAVDGSERIFGYRAVSTLPLVVAVGRSVAEVLAPVQAERRRAMVLGALTTLVIALFSFLFARELERRRRREDDLVRTGRELAAAEAQARRANHFLLIAEEMAHVGHWRVELPSLRQTWSPEIFRIYGLEPAIEAPTVAAAIAAYHPDDRARVDAHVNEAIARGQAFEFQLRLVRPTGEVRNVMSRGSVERDGAGVVTALFGVFFDITEAKRAQDERLTQAAVLSVTLESMDQGLIMVDADGKVGVHNRRAVEILDLDPEQMADQPSYRAVREAQRRAGKWGKLVEESAPHWTIDAGRQSRDVRCERRMPDGRVIEVRSVPVPGGGVVQTFTDISHLKAAETVARAAEAEAREANRMLVMAEEVAHVGHWRVAVPSNHLTWSDEVYRIHGRDPATFQPTVETAIGAYHPDDRDEVARCVGQAITAREPFEFTLRIVRPDGELRDVVARGRCELDGAGEVTAVFGAFLDVTELRQAERKASQTSALLSATLESMDQGLIVVSPGRIIEVCNRRAQELLDLPAALMQAKPTTQAVLDHQWKHGEFDGAEEPVRELMRGGGAVFGPHTYTRTRPTGTVLEIRTVPMANGGLVRTYADVTARHAAERAVAEKTALLGTTLENMDQGLVMIAPNGRVQVSNRRFAELLDLPAEFLAGRPEFEDVLAYMADRGEYAGTDSAFQAHVRDRGAPLTLGTYERGRPNGTVLEVRTTALPDGGVVRTYADITARWAAEAAVAQGEERYRLLAESTSDVITRLDLDFKRVYVSPTCRTLLGYAPEDMLGQQPSASVHPDDAPALRDLARRLVAGQAEGDKATATYRTRHQQGHWVWVEAGMTLVRDEATGAPSSIICSLRDVSERKQAEAARAESEARYRLLAENASDLIALKPTFEGKRSYVSPASRTVVGWEPEELAKLPNRDYVHPDDYERVGREFASLSAETSQLTSVHRVRHKEGRWVWVEAVFQLTQAGMPDEAVVVTARDVTARRTAEEALRESEARYRLLADNTTDLIVITDLKGLCRYVSPASLELTGFAPDELLGRAPAALAHRDDAAVSAMALAALAAGERERDVITWRLVRQDGRVIWVEVKLQLVRDAGTGAPLEIISTARDVTDRVAQARHLEQARAAAEAGAKVKAEFLANMSHELRTPLTGMLGVHDLLTSDPALSDRQRHFVGLAQESGRSLLTIVNDILDFSKIEAGEMAIERVPFSLRELVEACRQLGVETLKSKAVHLNVEVEADVPDLLFGDPTRVRQVLLNLTTNAIKFTAEGAVAIRATWTRAGTLRLSVSDSGIGIAPDAIPQLFERFSQADSSTTRRFGGTGLGLAICKRLVALMGGEIGVESTPGRGSTFWFELPMQPAEQDRREDRRASALGAAAARRWRILVAEDNGINQEIIRTVLAQKGHQVTMVGNGAEAVAQVRSGAFDVVLMDVQMPILDGLAAAAEIRSLEQAEARSPSPIIALTANAMIEEAERCRQAGMDAHVAKPIDWTQLFATIDRLCGQRTTNARAADAPQRKVTPVLDESALDTLASLLSREQIQGLLISFEREMRRRLSLMDIPAATAKDLGDHAHALVSLAGQLGFLELSALCAQLEGEAAKGGGLEQVGALRIVAERALAAAARSSYAQPARQSASAA